ncbi:MAG TPA: hypothetical protein VH661_04605 [Candidatus Dormibacteraeota bacterium]|jgi:hypothetical protein|nr:hypothetical protein [Candidatus Dormibacteraeota bacterium]
MRRVRELLPSGRHLDDDDRDRRTTLVMSLVDRFVFDLGLLAAGHEPDIESYVAADMAARLRTAMRPGLATGLTTRPDFGEYAQVRIEGDILDTDAAVRAVVEFDDQSIRVDARGRTVTRLRRHVRILLLFDPAITRVIEHRVEIA